MSNCLKRAKMPPYKSVEQLQNLSLNKFSNLLAISLANLANGRYANQKQKSFGMKSQKANSNKQLTMVIPIMEIQRIKRFNSQNIPKPMRNNVFLNVLRTITQIILNGDQLTGDKSKEYVFSEKITQLDEGVMYVYNVLISKEITNLDFTAVLHLSMKWVDSCRLSNMNPKETNLNYTRIETIFLKHFAENAKIMNNLVSITWPHLISGDLVRIISRHFQNLREITLACSCETGPFIEEERKGAGKVGTQEDLIASLRALFERCPGDFTTTGSPTGCPNLKRLILPNIDDEKCKAAETLADAIMVLKNLEAVSGISTLVSLIVLKKKNFSRLSLPLKTLNDYDPFKQRMVSEVEVLRPLLPRLESIELRVSEELTQRILSLFQDIKELSIEYPNFHTIAKNYGSLVYLNISLDFQCPWPLILILSKHCKYLKYLTLEHSTFKIDPQNLERMKYPKMQNLLFFKLIRSSFIEFAALYELVKGCPQLQELYLTLSNDRNYSVDEFGDDLLNAIAPYMKHLERFTAECLYKFNLYLHLNCTLTIMSAYTLANYCPNLRFIGHLDSWDVKDKDVKVLLSEIKAHNWDLEIA